MKEEQFLKEFYIAGLISRKLCTTLSTEEATALAVWEAEAPANQQLVDELTNIELLQAMLPAINKFNAEAAFERVTHMILLQGAVPTSTNVE